MSLKVNSRARRVVDRVRALSKVDLPGEQVVTLQLCVIGQELAVDLRPAFLMLPSRETPNHAFIAWHASETIADELRLMLAAGIWPGPEHAPSPAQLVADPSLDRVVAVTLYGAETDRPWSSFWRERRIKHGLYAVFFSPKGRVGVMLTHRDDAGEPFSAADIDFVEACAPYVGASLDVVGSSSPESWMAAEVVHLRFDHMGSTVAFSLFGGEMLRDLGGGGPGALARGREQVERALAFVPKAPFLQPEASAPFTLAGGPEERAMRVARLDFISRYAAPSQRPELPLKLGQNGFGRFELWPALMLARSGEVEVVASLTRFLPSLALWLRGAVEVKASGREMQLLAALDEGGALRSAAGCLDISEDTARTLGKRLARRAKQTGLRPAVDRLSRIGQTRWALAPSALKQAGAIR